MKSNLKTKILSKKFNKRSIIKSIKPSLKFFNNKLRIKFVENMKMLILLRRFKVN